MKLLKQPVVTNPIHDKLWNHCWNIMPGGVYSELYSCLMLILHVRDLISYDKEIGGSARSSL